MTTQQLIEYAALDALGLLEPHEHDDFEQAFRSAPAHVQAHVRREQKRFAMSSEALLPDVEPPAGLRFKVIAAVRDAMRKASPLHVNRDAQAAGRPFVLQIWSSARAWRVASLALASAAVTLGVIVFTLSSTQQNANDARAGDAAIAAENDLAERYGRDILDILHAAGANRENLAANPEFAQRVQTATASLTVDPASRSGVLLCRNLPVVNAAYRIAILDDNGDVLRTIKSFNASTTEQAIKIDNIELADAASIALVGPLTRDGGNEVILAVRFA